MLKPPDDVIPAHHPEQEQIERQGGGTYITVPENESAEQAGVGAVRGAGGGGGSGAGGTPGAGERGGGWGSQVAWAPPLRRGSGPPGSRWCAPRCGGGVREPHRRARGRWRIVRRVGVTPIPGEPST